VVDRDVSLDVVSYSRTRIEFTLIEPGLQSALGPPFVSRLSAGLQFDIGARYSAAHSGVKKEGLFPEGTTQEPP